MRPPPDEARAPKLLDRVHQVARLRHLSHRTESAYVQWIRRFILFHDKRHPRDMGTEQVIAFLNWLATERDVAAATQNQARSALVFLYRALLQRELEGVQDRTRARSSRRLPVVLTREEVRAVLAEIPIATVERDDALAGRLVQSIRGSSGLGHGRSPNPVLYRGYEPLCPTQTGTQSPRTA